MSLARRRGRGRRRRRAEARLGERWLEERDDCGDRSRSRGADAARGRRRGRGSPSRRGGARAPLRRGLPGRDRRDCGGGAPRAGATRSRGRGGRPRGRGRRAAGDKFRRAPPPGARAAPRRRPRPVRGDGTCRGHEQRDGAGHARVGARADRPHDPEGLGLSGGVALSTGPGDPERVVARSPPAPRARPDRGRAAVAPEPRAP